MAIHTVEPAVRQIARRTRGRKHGPVARLMSPSDDFGEMLKPFVFLDYLDHDVREPITSGLHPHSGIATVSHLTEGSVNYIDPDNVTGILPAGGVEWMQAGRGMWHGGSIDAPGRMRGFQLWIALPPHLELGPTISIYQSPAEIPVEGPARVLLGRYGSASSVITPPSPINYLSVRLRAGDRWIYEPPAGHTVLWTAISLGTVFASEVLRAGDLAAFDSSNESIEFEASSDAEFVVGSAAPHNHNLVLGVYSVHTSPEALHAGQERILEIRKRLIQEGRL
jgi:redox-sensitive bicupin YhaK (pirin superfamily)